MERNFEFRGWKYILQPKLQYPSGFDSDTKEVITPMIFEDTWEAQQNRRAYWNLPYIDTALYYEVQSTCGGCWNLRGVYPQHQLKQALMDVIQYSKIFQQGFFRIIDVSDDRGWGYINGDCWAIPGVRP